MPSKCERELQSFNKTDAMRMASRKEHVLSQTRRLRLALTAVTSQTRMVPNRNEKVGMGLGVYRKPSPSRLRMD